MMEREKEPLSISVRKTSGLIEGIRSTPNVKHVYPQEADRLASIHHKHNRFSLLKASLKPTWSSLAFIVWKYGQNWKKKQFEKSLVPSLAAVSYVFTVAKGHLSMNYGTLWAFKQWLSPVLRARVSRGHVRVQIIMKMLSIFTLLAAMQKILGDYEHAKWDGFSRFSPSVSDHALYHVRTLANNIVFAVRLLCMTIMRTKLPRNASWRFKLPGVTE